VLEEYLVKAAIRLNVNALDWEEAVRVGGQLLLDSGKCRPEYVEAMVRTVRELGPYMVLAPGLALAHARPEDGALALGLSLITLQDPVEFGSTPNDPVELVISFCAVDKEEHVDLLKELAAFLRKDENQEYLKKAVTVDEILSAFSRPLD
jgi:mannitol/fructose-specific phosphotransferase system IIA component (Ntr-type)